MLTLRSEYIFETHLATSQDHLLCQDDPWGCILFSTFIFFLHSLLFYPFFGFNFYLENHFICKQLFVSLKVTLYPFLE